MTKILYYVYITTNLINGKKYIGQHKQKIGEIDNYIGSGKLIKRAISKYGYDNFKKEILCFCDDYEELQEKEKYYIELYNASKDNNFYNIKIGGSQSYPFSGKTEEEVKEIGNKISKKLIELYKEKDHHMKGKKLSLETKEKISKSSSKENNGFYNRTHTEESKNKISQKLKGKEPWNKNKKLSEEYKKKLSEAHKTRTVYGNKIKVIVKDIDGNIIQIFDKINSCADYYNVNRHKMYNIISNSQKGISFENKFFYKENDKSNK